MDQKKLKTDKKDAKKKDVIKDAKKKDAKKDAKKKKGTFKFNDKDYSKEDDHTLESLKSIGKFNIWIEERNWFILYRGGGGVEEKFC